MFSLHNNFNTITKNDIKKKISSYKLKPMKYKNLY